MPMFVVGRGFAREENWNYPRQNLTIVLVPTYPLIVDFSGHSSQLLLRYSDSKLRF